MQIMRSTERAVPMARRRSFVVSVLAVIVLPRTAWAVNIAVGGGVRVERPVRTMKDLRDVNVIKQEYDYSCGAAALATLMRYGLNDNITERQVLEQLFRLLSRDELQSTLMQGFSLLHLQRVAQARGYRAEGFRLEPQFLSGLSGPVIVYIQPRGYKHFAVLRGIKDDRVFLADPSLGNIRMPIYQFLESWRDNTGTGIIFVVEQTTGVPYGKTPLTLSIPGLAQPEIMTARELLAVGTPFLTLPELSR
jgi:predicted double-glycine peptidase